MAFSRRKRALLALVVLAAPAFTLFAINRARGSDHADTPAIAAAPGTDLTDVYIFPSPTDPNNVVLAMNVHPLIASGAGPTTPFDPNVLYQFKIDNSGDNVEDLVIQAKFNGSTAGSQTVQIAGPVAPSRTGTTAVFETPNSTTGNYNTTFTLTNGAKVFAGPREDPFFFDLNQFFTILPDRASSISATIVNTNGQTVSTTPANPNQPQATTWRPFGVAPDFLKNLNVLSIVVELPKTAIKGAGNGTIGLWCTTSR